MGMALVGGLAVVVESQAAVVRPNIYAVMPGPDGVAVHVLSGSSYDVWGENALTAAPAVTDRTKWQYAFGDANGDGIADLYAIDTKDDGDGSGLHIYDGKSRFDKVLLNQKMSGVGTTADTSRFRFFTGDADGDGTDDLFLVDGRSGDGTNTAVHVFMAANRFAAPSLNRPLAMGSADFARHSFAAGDVDGDRHADVYFVDSGTAASASTALHVASYKGGYTRFETNRVLPKFGFTPTSRWAFSAADYDGDGKADVVAVDSQNNGGKNLAVHVVTAASGFQKFGLQHASAVAGLNLSLVGAVVAWKDTAPPATQVTLADLKAIYGTIPNEATVSAGLAGLNAEMVKARITTPARKAAFLATLRNESGFRYNAVQGGATGTYKGRGYIQLTGSANYASAGDYLNHNFTDHPDDAASLAWSAPIARWYWTVARDINPAADDLDMGAVDDAIGYAPNSAEDTQRCNDFKAALRYFAGSLPSGINCTRH
jgi:predicted chitinase